MPVVDSSVHVRLSLFGQNAAYMVWSGLVWFEHPSNAGKAPTIMRTQEKRARGQISRQGQSGRACAVSQFPPEIGPLLPAHAQWSLSLRTSRRWVVRRFDSLVLSELPDLALCLCAKGEGAFLHIARYEALLVPRV